MTEFKRPRPIVLCILDGWGHREERDHNAIALAKTPNFDRCWNTLPHALLGASGMDVGLPDGQMGNSEVGHTVLGAGRAIWQDLPRIHRAIANGEFAKSPVLQKFVGTLRRTGGTCHLLGLVSPGGVHSHVDHIKFLAEKVAEAGIPVALHAFADGRDTPPQSALIYIKQLNAELAPIPNITFATLCGRCYAMDRDKRWERVAKAYDAIVNANGEHADNSFTAIANCYSRGETDEFMMPTVLGNYQGMKNGDGILHANFRMDRAREILAALVMPDFSGFNRTKTVRFSGAAGIVEYSEELNKYIDTLLPHENIQNTAGEIISRAGLTQLRIAETEKYAQTTFFFNGGTENIFQGEDRILIPSIKVPTYDKGPQMASIEVTDRLMREITSDKYDFVVVNYANGDMVGHTGLISAAIEAVEYVDQCLGRVIAAVKKQGGTMLLTADHGNCERMRDPKTGEPHAWHTYEPVPAILINGPKSIGLAESGTLPNVAPTILELMGLPRPAEMAPSLLRHPAPG